MSSTIRFLSMISLGLVLTGCGSDSPTTQTATPVGADGFTIISPNGGETFKVGGLLHIKWSITNINSSSASPYLRCDAGEWLNLIPNGSISNMNVDTTILIGDSLYSSTVKKNIPFPIGTTCKMKVRDYQLASLQDTSDAPFTIQAK
jgi:hypothetical protein